MREVEFKGTTIDEALKNASEELKLTADNIDFEIVSLGSKGFLGVGKKPAAIKVLLKKEKASSSERGKGSKRPKKDRPEQKAKPAQKEKSEPRREKKDSKRAPKRDNKKKEARPPRKEREPRREREPRKESDRPALPEVILDPVAHADNTKRIGEFVSYIASRIDDDINVSAEILNNKVVVTIETSNTGKIIGKGGRLINSIEYLAIKLARVIFEERVKVIVQVNGERKAN